MQWKSNLKSPRRFTPFYSDSTSVFDPISQLATEECFNIYINHAPFKEKNTGF